MHVEGEGPRSGHLHFETNTDDEVTVDADHPLRVEDEPGTGGLKPYVLVRGRLEALVSRALFYDLVALGTVEGEWFGVWSSGIFWPMKPARDIGIEHSMSDFRFDSAEFVERARTRLLATAPLSISRAATMISIRTRAPFPMTGNPREPRCWCRSWRASRKLTVLMIRRTDTLRNHSGQIAFPGGKIEASDERSGRCRLARGRGGNRLAAPAGGAARLSRWLSDAHRPIRWCRSWRWSSRDSRCSPIRSKLPTYSKCRCAS